MKQLIITALAISILPATVGCTARSEAIEAAVIDRAAKVMDKAVATCDFIYSRGASFGAINRRFFQDRDTATAYMQLFHNSGGLQALPDIIPIERKVEVVPELPEVVPPQ